MYIYKGSLAVHGVALGKLMVSPAIEMCHPILLGEMDMAACYFSSMAIRLYTASSAFSISRAEGS